jgi:hypothetical protein
MNDNMLQSEDFEQMAAYRDPHPSRTPAILKSLEGAWTRIARRCVLSCC